MRKPHLIAGALLAVAALATGLSGGPGGVIHWGSGACGGDRGTSSRFQRSSH